MEIAEVAGWIALAGRAESLEEDDLAEVLQGIPVLGCQLVRLPSGELEVTVFLAAEEDSSFGEVARALTSIGVVGLESRQVQDEDWLAAYRDGVEAFPVGKLWWVDPHPHAPTVAPAGRTRLAVEPSMAFGSGSHESTRLVLLELEGVAGTRPGFAGVRVLDVGTGSGILALAADRLGANEVVGLDIDPVAVRVAQRTAAQQEWCPRIRFLVGPVAALGGSTFDLVLCNMLPEEFLPLLTDLERVLARRGRLILSGIVDERRDDVVRSLLELRLSVVGESSADEWCCLNVSRGPVEAR